MNMPSSFWLISISYISIPIVQLVIITKKTLIWLVFNCVTWFPSFVSLPPHPPPTPLQTQGPVYTMDASEEGFVTGGKDGMAKLWDSDFKNITTVNLASAPGGYKGSACESSNMKVLSVECTWTCCLPCWLMGCWLGWFSWMCCSWKKHAV